MVKINITIEGEDLEEIIDELLKMGIDILKSNRDEIENLMRLLADDAVEVMSEKKRLAKFAELYKKINTEINWTYRRDGRQI